MLSFDYTKDLLNLQDVNVIKIEHFKTDTLIYTQLPIKPHVCPCCSHITSYIHDYRIRKIKDVSAFGKNITLIHNHRRYFGAKELVSENLLPHSLHTYLR